MIRQIPNTALAFATAMAAIAFETACALTPLSDLGSGLYLNQFQGGLYPNASNEMPSAHATEGLARAAAIRPLNEQGDPTANGRYALISIGMSNTTQEFCGANNASACRSWTFMGQAATHPDVNRTSLVLINGAAGGKSAAYWDSPTDSDYNRVLTDWLEPNGLSEKQVQAAWVKVANPGPTVSLPDINADAYRLVRQMGDVARALKTRYPNLQQVFFSSRIYAGYATTSLNPEPYAYESGLAVKWLIEAQINQMNGGGGDPLAGDLNYASGVAPWIAWGPYLWADGIIPRSDGLIWERTDLAGDGTHPSAAGQRKVADMLLDFMLNSPFTRAWFGVPIEGDYDRNGIVDAADYVMWRETDRSQTGYNTWRANFARTANAASLSDATVPEPANSLLLLMGATLAIRNRHRRDRHCFACTSSSALC